MHGNPEAQIITDGTTEPPIEQCQNHMESTQATQEQGSMRDTLGAHIVTGGTSNPTKEDGQKCMGSKQQTQEKGTRHDNPGAKIITAWWNKRPS
jgi:hypothetical protein